MHKNTQFMYLVALVSILSFVIIICYVTGKHYERMKELQIEELDFKPKQKELTTNTTAKKW